MVSLATRQLVVIGLGTAAIQLDTAVNIAFPAITRGFALAIGDIQWVVISYVLTYACLLLVCGRIGDLVGHARIFRLGLVWTSVAQLLCAMAGEFSWLLGARMLQGVGAALVLSGGPALATGLFDEARRTRVLGSFAMLIGIAATLGPWIGGVLVQHWDWPAVFWFRVPVALAALALFRPDTAYADQAARGAVASWRLFDPAFFRLHGFAAVNIASIVVNFAAFAVWLLVPYYLSRVAGLGYGPGGALLSMGAIGAIVASFLGGRAIGWIAARQAAALGASVVAAGLLLVGLWDETTSIPVLVAALVLQGIGLGLFQLAYTDIVTATLPRADRGVAGSLTVMTRTIGTVMSAAAVMPIFQHFETTTGFLPVFQVLFLSIAAVPLAMALLLAWQSPR